MNKPGLNAQAANFAPGFFQVRRRTWFAAGIGLLVFAGLLIWVALALVVWLDVYKRQPEHLDLSMADAEEWVEKIHHAGAIFIGPYTSESLGDYCAGPNHVLPTSGSARFSSPLGVYDFQKRSSLIRVSASAAKTLGRIASTLARGEGLTAHARAAEYRVEAGS